MPERSSRHRAIVQAFFDKLGHENDIDGWLKLFSPDVVAETPVTPPGGAKRFEGIEAIDRRYGDARRPLPHFTFIDVEILATEDPERWLATCTSKGAVPDGRQYQNSYCWIFRIVDDRIVWWIEYYDPYEVVKVS